MEWETATTDHLEQLLAAAEAQVSRARAVQLQVLRELDRRQVPTADGCRTLVEWVSGRLDLASDSARSLVAAARILEARPHLEQVLARGDVTVDRAAAVAAHPGMDLHTSTSWDVDGVRRLAARRRRISRHEEAETETARFLFLQPSLDTSCWRLSGQLGPVAGKTVEEALSVRADTLPAPPDGMRPGRPQLLADALEAICHDSHTHNDTTNGSGSAGGAVSVFVDATHAIPTGGEAGCEISGGPPIGPATLEEILCGARVDTIALTPNGPVKTGRSRSDIPPAVRRYVVWRDQARCTADGCTSRHRLQPHHITPRSAGGGHDPDNLTLLCWWHHHVVIHRRGYRIDPDSPPGRRRFLAPPPGPDPP